MSRGWSGRASASSSGAWPIPSPCTSTSASPRRRSCKVAKREDVQRDLFADPEQEYREAVQFYKHPMDWTNRMILGDSLAVMASLARREALAGKVQMIYMDPPYGIKYASNFQPEVGTPRREGQGRRPHPRAGNGQGLPRHVDPWRPFLSVLSSGPVAAVQGTPGGYGEYLCAD